MALDRFELDRVARAVVTGNRGSSRRIDRLADAIAGLMTSRLAAVGAPGKSRARRRRVIPKEVDDPRVFRALLDRVGKHLGAYAAGAVREKSRSS
jgi:hypothetical protein